MIQCPKCSAEIAQDSRFCKFCGELISTPSQMPTMEAPAAIGQQPGSGGSGEPSPHVARVISSDSIPAGGFTPGTTLADRYRIIGLLGRGGMGEVYRADDLKLGQPVALKFLPPKLADDPMRRERFFAEVRITRQLSHPNICRVYDIGEIDGRHFLSMEFIDGEDLASLLKRIGHLTNEKALDIARQLAAGLAAAHERGVLHRDLKPANIMLDGHGRVRITDFGLAIAVGDESQAEEIAGTPAYMAPEQLAGKGATVRSDIYSLGLVLYEVYTGKKAFTATTLAELRQQKETHTPRAISELREGMDSVVERLVRRCMERDPNARPASVAQLGLALPGGDPLAAAIAAGETPSPEMVAASGSREGLRPAVAWGILALIIVGLIVDLAIKDRIALHRRIPFENSPEILVERSHEILKKLGFTEKFKDSAYGFTINAALISYQKNLDRKADRGRNWDAKTILFWYRQSPRSFQFQSGTFSQDNPPLKHPGEVLVQLDTEGRLVSLSRVPSQAQSKAETAPSLDWDSLFAEAGLEYSQWKEKEAQWIPDSYADFKTAWIGLLPGFPEAEARIQGASYRGRPVRFTIIGPWLPSDQTESPQQPLRGTVARLGNWLIIVSAVLGGILLARRNMRLGRGDRRNANRLALFVLCVTVLWWACEWPHFSFNNLLLAPYLAVLVWVIYMAIEPFVRRRWPSTLVSWTRLLSGEWRDPLVMRDVLIGCAFSVFISCILISAVFLPPRLFAAPDPPIAITDFIEGFMGWGSMVGGLLGRLLFLLFMSLATFCLLILLRVLLRSQIASIAVCILFMTMALGIQVGYAAGLFFGAIWFFILMRFGFVAAFFSQISGMIAIFPPTTLVTSAWYARYGYFALAIFAAIVLYAFRNSLGGRPLIAVPRLDD